jgi:DNA adenine methylase
MFRYNSNGDFNVPYGGIAYNRKNYSKKIDYLKTKELKSLLENTKIENLDFEDFFILHKPKKNDFIFLDPPYDSEFSTYAKNEFTRKDQERLANFMINKCEAKWMMIIKNTDYIFGLYDQKGLNINSFDKKYLVSFMNRNDKNVEHLIITNY